MYCRNCGTKIIENNNFCSNCGAPIKSVINENNIQHETNQIDKRNNEAKILCILSLIFTYSPWVITSLLSQVSTILANIIGGLSPLIGLVLMVIARTKYPESKLAKAVMYIYITSIVASLIFFIILYTVLYFTCSDMGTMGIVIRNL